MTNQRGAGLVRPSQPIAPTNTKRKVIIMADENKVTIKDIINLALKGYSKEDIKELFALAQAKEAEGEEAEQKTTVKEQPKDEAEPKGPEATGTSEADSKDSSEDTDLKAENEKLKKALAEAQKSNNEADLSDKTDNQTDEQVINELARAFM